MLNSEENIHFDTGALRFSLPLEHRWYQQVQV